MKTTASVAAALLALALAGCAATSPGTPSSAELPAVPRVKAVAGSTLYCVDGKFLETSDGYRCAWAATQRDACAANTILVIPKDSVASGPTKGGMCMHGDRITYLTTR